jgi:hypothetical protein
MPTVGPVWFESAMGLLDDAIREHLELKRLRGADPGTVAREAHDALGPIRREDESDAGGDESTDESSRDTGRTSSPHPESLGNDSAGGQETIEINMEAEFAAGTDQGHGHGAVSAKRPVPHPAHTPPNAEESLEWEVPGDRSDSADGAGSGDDTDSREGTEEHVEDVLEETPDFLRDTPEQERLWFEQRPPRDFDFNE